MGTNRTTSHTRSERQNFEDENSSARVISFVHLGWPADELGQHLGGKENFRKIMFARS